MPSRFFFGALDRKTSPIEPPLRSLITTRVSQLTGCPFCIQLNSRMAMERGAQGEKVKALENIAASPLFTEREKAALQFAEALTQLKVTSKHHEALKKHFNERQIVELAALASYQNMAVRFNQAFGL